LQSDLDRIAVRIVTIASERLALLRARIQGYVDFKSLLQPAIRDVHHDHVLFTGEEVSGIVDFGSLRIDTPLADIARLVGSLVGDDQEARTSALDAYARLRPLTVQDRQLIELLDESGLVLSGLNWLTWLYIDHCDLGPIEPIVRRLDEILARLEHK
jgi:Ser/Thr protein kinase RdoA (MazF antagonist)